MPEDHSKTEWPIHKTPKHILELLFTKDPIYVSFVRNTPSIKTKTQIMLEKKTLKKLKKLFSIL